VAPGCRVAGDGDGTGLGGITYEVADVEVHVERQVEAHEGKAAGDHDFDGMVCGVENAEMLRCALPHPVGAGRYEGIRDPVIFFRLLVLQCQLVRGWRCCQVLGRAPEGTRRLGL